MGVLGYIFIIYFCTIFRAIPPLERGEKPGIINVYLEGAKASPTYLLIKLLALAQACLWALVLIVPGLVVAVYYLMAGLAFLIDGKKGREALAFSKAMIKPRIFFFLDNALYMTMVVTAVVLPWILMLKVLRPILWDHAYYVLSNLCRDFRIFLILLWVNLMAIGAYYFYKQFKEFLNTTGSGVPPR